MNLTFYKFKNIIISLSFLLLIFLPFIKGIIEKDVRSSKVEKRNLAMLPELPESIGEIVKYPTLFDQYYSDHFGFRESLTMSYFKIMKKINYRSITQDVTFGKGGWMFLGAVKAGYNRYGDPIGDVMNVNLYTEEELEKFRKSIMAVKSWLNKRGIEYIFMVAPNKHTIYFENLPEYISKQNKESAADQLIKYLRKNTDLTVVDVRKELLEEKKKHQVYFKTDTHWNHFAANIVQFKIMKEIEMFFPNKILPELLFESDFTMIEKNDGDLLGIAKVEGITEMQPMPNFEKGCDLKKEMPVPGDTRAYTVTCESENLNAVIFRDSFFIVMEPYFSRKFKRSTYLMERLNYSTLTNYVESEKPDIVIEEWVERDLPHVPDHSSFINESMN